MAETFPAAADLKGSVPAFGERKRWKAELTRDRWIMQTRPQSSEAAEYYFRYIDQVPDGDILDILNTQKSEVRKLLEGISDQDSLRRYAPDKWSIREVVSHISDTERLFAFRAFWFARGFSTSLPGFDQNVAASAAHADSRAWHSLTQEFQAVRAASLSLFESLGPRDWSLRGIASDNPFTVRALAYLTAGHVTHHVKILRSEYLNR